MSRPTGKAKTQTPFYVCWQIARYVESKGLELALFVRVYCDFAQTYSIIYQQALLAGKKRFSSYRSAESGRDLCKHVWYYSVKHKLEPLEFAQVLKQYSELKQDLLVAEQKLSAFKEKYDAPRVTVGDSA